MLTQIIRICILNALGPYPLVLRLEHTASPSQAHQNCVGT